MARENINDLIAFVLVAKERSFTKAAAQLGVSQPALSKTIRNLEERLGIRLLIRTTRSVSPTEAGERLFAFIGPRISEIEEELSAVTELLDKPTGTVRIATSSHAADTILWPKIRNLAPDYPDIIFEIIVDNGLTDIAAERFDLGVRLGEQVANGMIAMRIGPDMRFAVVGSPDYFKRHPVPRVPNDLLGHNCINIRLASSGGLYAWEFENGKQEVRVKVDGQFVFNSQSLGLDAVIKGLGLGLFFTDIVQPHVADGSLVSVLQDWCQPFSGYHVYYPSRRLLSPAFNLLMEALRYRP